MANIIEFTPQAGALATPGEMQQQIDLIWWRLFDVQGAVKALDEHLATLGGDQTEEQHTRKSYESSLRYFLNWAADSPVKLEDLRGMTVYEFARLYPAHRFPGPGLLTEYVAHYKRQGRAKSTIDRHLAPVRLYIKALTKQYVLGKGETRQLVDDCRHFMGQALETKVPKNETWNNVSPLYQHGERLTVAQVKDIFTHLQQDGLMAKRDLAIMYVGFNAALRDAEIRRLTLGDIRQGPHTLEMHVRGKRNNRAPVPLDATGYALITQWVEAYNAGLAEDDPRRIGDGTPVFQSLRQGGRYRVVGRDKGFSPGRGIGKDGLRDIVQRVSAEVLGYAISPHDMRRTVAAIGHDNGMDLVDLQTLLRHKSVQTTKDYIGNPSNLQKSLLSNRVDWNVQAG